MKRANTEPPAEPAAPEPVTAEIYVCNFCNQPFARDYTVLSHIKHKHWSPTLQPRECYATLQLGSTILKVPNKKAKVHGLFSCVLCGSTMTREPTAGHICIGPDGSLTCINTCPDGKKLLYLEMNYLFTDKQGYLCDTCGDVFKVPVHLDTHLLKVHGIMTDRHKRCQCHICGTTFSLPSHVKKHIIHKHTVDGKACKYMCDICGKNYDRLDSMMVHKRRHHTEGKRFQCEHCPKKFFGRSHWLNHTRQHFGASNYVCRWCNQQFSSSYSLKVHQRKHTGEKPYQCKSCDACFAQKTSLTVHMKKHQKLQFEGNRNIESVGMKRTSSEIDRRSDTVHSERQNSDKPTSDLEAKMDTTHFESSSISKQETLGPRLAESQDVEETEMIDSTTEQNKSRQERTDRVGMLETLGASSSSTNRPPRPGRDPGMIDALDSPASGSHLNQLTAPASHGDVSPSIRHPDFQSGGGESFVPLGHRRMDERVFGRQDLIRDGHQWESQAYGRSDTFDSRRYDDVASINRRMGSHHGHDNQSEPKENSVISSHMSSYGTGSNQVTFPPFSYPGSSYYY